MKKTLSIVLALAFVVAAFASFALTADSSKTNPFKIVSIKVSDAAGYSNPYAAVDSAAAFTENQAAYVVAEYNLAGYDSDVSYKANTDVFRVYDTTITSSTLDLGYSEATKKYQAKLFDGSITAADSNAANLPANVKGVFKTFAYDSTKAELNVALDASQVYAQTSAATAETSWKANTSKSKVEKYFVAFIGVTKAATAGEIKASLKGSSTKFASYTDVVGTGTKWTAVSDSTPTLLVYDSTGAVKYTIYKIGDSYRVFAGKSLEAGDAKSYLFDYVQTGSLFNYIGYAPDYGTAWSTIGTAVGFTYDGKLVYLGANGKLDGTDDKDLTSVVTDANTFFGFTFATSNAAGNGDFEKKTAGNPTVVTDTYAYVTAAVTTPDDVDIAPTGDFSANIVIVLAASAVLAAAALAFVAKKARD